MKRTKAPFIRSIAKYQRDQKPLNQVRLTVQAVNGMLDRGII